MKPRFFYKRLGRLGRHKGFKKYIAYSFVPVYVLEKLEMHLPKYCNRSELIEIINECHRSVNNLDLYYTRWSPVQSMIIGQQLKETREAIKTYYHNISQLWGQDLRKVISQITEWRDYAKEYGLSNLIAKEAVAFRDSSPLQCAILMPDGRPTTYNLPTILSHYQFHFIDKETFPNWFYQVNHCHIFLQLDKQLDQRTHWKFYLEESIVKRYAGVLNIIKGITIINHYQSDILRQQLKSRYFVVFIVECSALELKQYLKLPFYFPLYDLQVEPFENHSIYSIAFSKHALYLDALLGEGKTIIQRENIRKHCEKIIEQQYENDEEFIEIYSQKYGSNY